MRAVKETYLDRGFKDIFSEDKQRVKETRRVRGSQPFKDQGKFIPDRGNYTSKSQEARKSIAFL